MSPTNRKRTQDLGLDMAHYDAVDNDPATLDRIEADRQDGLRLGVQEAPDFLRQR